MTRRTREFEKPKFREKPKGAPKARPGKRFRPKKAGVNRIMSSKDRKAIGKVI
jgi:hypothetical protein